ncbi:MAG: UDP-N-acetylmuramate dehydrogenase [Pseudohongiellaceae bacterium]
MTGTGNLTDKKSAVTRSPLTVARHIDLGPFTTFGVPGRARFYVALDSPETLEEAIAWHRPRKSPLLVLGGGSNVLLQHDFPGLVLHVRTRGIEVLSETADTVTIRIAAGENWHGLVMYTLERGWFGLENLALIPGTVGAAPIQNIGAYGVELDEFIVGVDATEIASGNAVVFDRDQCEFSYRDSLFKNAEKGRFLVTAVTLRLSRHARVNTDYHALQQELKASQADPQSATPQQVAEAVCRVRRRKLPDPAKLGNAGSFFKNPVVAREVYQRLQSEYPQMPSFAIPGDDRRVKLPAGWMLERAGWKGVRMGTAGVHEEQALVIVNHGGATAEDVLELAAAMQADVQSRFGITLEREVQVV